ncbi:MAG: hypothetical protein ACRCUK_06420 [Plesiomonas shigelloides]
MTAAPVMGMSMCMFMIVIVLVRMVMVMVMVMVSSMLAALVLMRRRYGLSGRGVSD